ncbi:hypothetical protein DFH29DRAFT_601376 [Suillus ampliporus]|nr:hypothetical protein DFH29DRAFT_601376 [Suillus ampliporus]
MPGKLLVFLITLPAMSSLYPLTPGIHFSPVNPPSSTSKSIFRRKPGCYSVLLPAQHLFCHCCANSPPVLSFVIFAQCFYIWVF